MWFESDDWFASTIFDGAILLSLKFVILTFSDGRRCWHLYRVPLMPRSGLEFHISLIVLLLFDRRLLLLLLFRHLDIFFFLKVIGNPQILFDFHGRHWIDIFERQVFCDVAPLRNHLATRLWVAYFIYRCGRLPDVISAAVFDSWRHSRL